MPPLSRLRRPSLLAVLALAVAAAPLPATLHAQGARGGAAPRVVVGLVDLRVLLRETPGRDQIESEFALEQAHALRPREREAYTMVLRARELAFEDMIAQLGLAAETRRSALEAPLLTRVRAAVRVVREREGVQLVLDSGAMPAIVDADAVIDLTPKVLVELRRATR
ncbi:MAG: OmpH family outer membrane protein [Gemmatimonadaceae bacterium]|nr:OmpH family outer membrane protein [Gemmatimonadaceae bacterium]